MSILNPSDLSYVPVTCVVHGVITSKIKKTETYEVSVYHTPLGAFNGTVYASANYMPGLMGNYKQNDIVKMLMTFTFGGVNSKHLTVQPGSHNHILGLHREKSIFNIKVENPLTQSGPDRVTFVNEKSKAGLVLGNNGETLLSSSGSIYTSLKAFGNGSDENYHKTHAQNHHRIISHNKPYLVKEHFGLFSGTSLDDKLTRLTDEDKYIIYRRFVTQTKSPKNWVSTCEGAWTPWMGANNDNDYVSARKEVLLHKVINHDDSRTTIEIGEPGDSFINLRIDKVIVGEKHATGNIGATPAQLGNKFKLIISDTGAVKLSAAGKGIPSSNMNGFSMEITEDGDLTINAKGKITLSHGDNDVNTNSIVLDPEKGIDLIAKNGLRFNGLELVTKAFIDWLSQNQASLVQVTQVGAVAPISPAALPGLTIGVQSISDAGGFTTKNIGAPATGIIEDSDQFESI